MATAALAEVGARLQEAVAGLPGEPGSPQDAYERYEMLAIQILDSEFDAFAPGLLEEYLRTLLRLKALELGLDPDAPA